MVICFFGDSLVNGTGDPACLGWAGRACVQVAATGRNLTYYNLGVRKHSSRDVLERWEAEANRRRLEGFQMRLVFAFGTADTVNRNGRRNVSLEETRSNTQALLQAATQKYEILFVGPPPVAGDEHCARSRELNKALGTECARLGVPYFDMMVRLGDEYLADVRANDGVHPRNMGYAEMAQAFSSWFAWQQWFE